MKDPDSVISSLIDDIRIFEASEAELIEDILNTSEEE